MKREHILLVLVILIIFTNCTPAGTAVTTAETAASTSASTPTPLTATNTQTLTPEISTPTIEPTSISISLLSEEGPWLLYLHNHPRPGGGGSGPTPAEFILVNQDGSGRTLITLPECYDNVSAFLLDGGNSANYLAQYDQGIYLFRPALAEGMLLYHQLSYYYGCRTYFNGDEEDGLLASFYQESADVSPELILFRLSSGEIVERFPLVSCPENTDFCEEQRSSWPQMMAQRPEWSPDGRYLAFVAVLDRTSSDIFIYDTQEGDLRRLTDDPAWVGGIDWSPDGSQIIMEELISDDEHLSAPFYTANIALWSVSVSTGETQYLYPTTNDEYGTSIPQRIWYWLDDHRFISSEGALMDADSATNLRLVDMRAGTNLILFDGRFVDISFDRIHQTFALYELYSQEYEQGIYMVSLSNGSIQYTNFYWTIREWDANTGLFISDQPCEEDPEGLQALDYQGNLYCMPNPAPTATSTPTPMEKANYPAPNEQWAVNVNDGIWLEAGGEPPVLVSQETAGEVIWCPDSSCFFFTVAQEDGRWSLYHVSVPDLTIQIVDEGIISTGSYQWLGRE